MIFITAKMFSIVHTLTQFYFVKNLKLPFKVTVDLQSAFRKMLCLRTALKKTMVNYISLES